MSSSLVGALFGLMALASGASTGSIMDVEHIVVFMQENRAFDHYYGSMKGVRGFNDRAAPTLPNGDSPFRQPVGPPPAPENFCGCNSCDFDWKTSGSEVQTLLLGLGCQPLTDLLLSASPSVKVTQGELCSQLLKDVAKSTIDHLNVSLAIGPNASCNATQTVTGLKLEAADEPSYMLPFPLMFQDTAATCMPAPEMDYHCNIKMWNGGNVDGWNTQRDPGFGMSFFNRTDLDFYYALADEFSVGDQYFQSTYTATNPNREFLFTGSNGLSVNNSGFCLLDDSEPAGLTWETMAETLIKKNISWKVYQGQDNFDDNGFAWFEQFKAAKPGDPLHDLGMIRQDDFVQSFAGDVANDTLPQVSWIVGPSSLSEHATNHPVDGMDLTARLLAALSANPAVYAKTVFILNYDEGGQFYDHVVPPSAPRSAEDGASTVSTVGELTLTTEFEIPVGNPIGPGWRVPLFLVSPWTRAPGGLVYSQVSDHTSVIKFIEKRFSVTCPNMSPWRRTTTGDLTAAFDWNNPDFTWPSLPSTKGDVNASKYQCMDNPPPVVPKIQSMPRQEPGVKQSRALPYEFQISDALSHDDVNQDYITITIANTGNATAVFHVYDRNLALSTPQKFTVEPSKQLQPRWRFTVLGKYALDLHGPNGFVRKFRGNGADSLSVRLEYQPEQRNVNLKLTGGAGCALNVQDLGYGGGPWTIAAGASEFPINVTATGNWYDLKVTSSCDGDFSRRFMGRMETGVTSITDPAMGSHVPADTEIHPSVPERLRHPVWDPVEQCKAPRMKMKDACWYVNHRKDEL